jgi:transposase
MNAQAYHRLCIRSPDTPAATSPPVANAWLALELMGWYAPDPVEPTIIDFAYQHMPRQTIMNTVTLGIDLGKNNFYQVGTNRAGKPLIRHSFTRHKLSRFVAKQSPCLIGMEACPGSQHLVRMFESYAHQVKLMQAQCVKPCLKSNKNDFNDAGAIAEAVRRPTMRFVTTKTVEQHDLQALHRVRERLIRARTNVICRLRSFLLENGITV